MAIWGMDSSFRIWLDFSISGLFTIHTYFAYGEAPVPYYAVLTVESSGIYDLVSEQAELSLCISDYFSPQVTTALSSKSSEPVGYVFIPAALFDGEPWAELDEEKYNSDLERKAEAETERQEKADKESKLEEEKKAEQQRREEEQKDKLVVDTDGKTNCAQIGTSFLTVPASRQ